MFCLRVTPLHNIREPGLIPNGFQKEDASPPAPDPRMQPEMRNRVEAQTDTRHAIELFNPRARLETNDPNRTNNTDPSRMEMGREGQQNQVSTRSQEQPLELHDAYERLLRILLGGKPSVGSANRAAGDTGKPESGAKADNPITAANQQVTSPGILIDDSPAPSAGLTYYQRRGVEAYRAMQAFAGESSVKVEA